MTQRKIALSIEEAADYTGIGRNTLRKLVEWKKLPVLKVGRKVLIKTDMLPYAVNTHRLLVRGVRVEEAAPTPEPAQSGKEPPDARRLLQNVVLPALAAVLFGTMLVLLMKVIRGGKRK